MKAFSLGIVLVLALFCSPMAANAQSFGDAFGGMGNNDEPIQIEADKLEIIDTQNTALLTGNVTVVQGKTILKARTIKVYYLKPSESNKSNNGIRKIEASSKVAVRSGDNHVTADKATIDMVTEFVTLSGNVLISQGNNIVKGCQASVNLKTNVSQVKPCKGQGSGGGRIKILLDPKSRKQN